MEARARARRLSVDLDWGVAENAVFGALERRWKVGRTLPEQLAMEAEACLSMFMRRDSHSIGASAFKEGRTPRWPHHGL